MTDLYFRLDIKAIMTFFVKVLLISLTVFIVLISLQLPASKVIMLVTSLILGIIFWFIRLSIVEIARLFQYTLWDDKHKQERVKPPAVELASIIRSFFEEENNDMETLQVICKLVPYVPASHIFFCIRPSNNNTKDTTATGLTNVGENISVSVQDKAEDELDEKIVGNFLLWKWQNYLMIRDRNENYEPGYIYDEEEQEQRFPPILWIKYDPKTLTPLDHGFLTFFPRVELILSPSSGMATGICRMVSSNGEGNFTQDSSVGFFTSYVDRSYDENH
jgi:hypothetical protein